MLLFILYSLVPFPIFWCFLPLETLYRRPSPPLTCYSINLCFRMDKRAGGISKVDNPEIYRDTAIRALAMSNAVMVSVLSAVTVGKIDADS